VSLVAMLAAGYVGGNTDAAAVDTGLIYVRPIYAYLRPHMKLEDMRYVRVRMTPTEGTAFHPLSQQLADEPAVTPEAIHRSQLLEDGTVANLAEVRGDRDRYEEILSRSPCVYDYAVTGTDGRWYSYTHFEPTALTRRMERQRRKSEVMVEMPILLAEDGSMEFTFVGDREGVVRAVPDTDDYEIEVLATGDYRSTNGELFACLTARQQDILDAAVRHGYYQNPREATHDDIAAVVDISPSTVGEHLRKIESRVFSEFVREGED
jgi:predicted DNA binding protein